MLGRRLAEGRGRLGVGEADAEPEAGQVVPDEPLDERALRLVVGQVHPRREQQLAARQPWRRIGELGDVDPADRALEPRLTRHEADVEVADQVTEQEHG